MTKKGKQSTYDPTRYAVRHRQPRILRSRTNTLISKATKMSKEIEGVHVFVCVISPKYEMNKTFYSRKLYARKEFKKCIRKQIKAISQEYINTTTSYSINGSDSYSNSKSESEGENEEEEEEEEEEITNGNGHEYEDEDEGIE